MTPEEEKFGLRELIALGVGGMIGGGIFSVMGLAVDITGHATPIAFGLGGLVALTAGYSYVRLALTYRSDGASFTYLERAFPNHPNVGGVVGWTVVAGYIGTLALYAFTFGAYGADLLGSPGSTQLRIALSTGVLVAFMAINLQGTRSSGLALDVLVYLKIALLAVFGIAGFMTIDTENLTPVVNEGVPSIFMAGALIFVGFEGFQLITNAVLETKNPERNIPWAIYSSIAITSAIYIAVSIAAVGNLAASEIRDAEEYALAAAAEPVLGSAGVVLVGVAAILATSSAINGTTFGASRMMWQMATQEAMPTAFSFRNQRDVPSVAVVTLTVLAVAFSVTGGLTVIAAFSSMTFLLVSFAVSGANYLLRDETNCHQGIVLFGLVLMTATMGLLIYYLSVNDSITLVWILGIYATVIAAELLFSERRLFERTPMNR